MPQLALLTPLGEVTLTEEDGAIVALDWGRGCLLAETPLLRAAADQLQDWFDGALAGFSVPLAPRVTNFQARVLAALSDVPPGQITSYGAIARLLATSPRAVGNALGANPIPIIIPCHRVTSSGGSLGGYSGLDGVETKRWLLAHEARHWCTTTMLQLEPHA